MFRANQVLVGMFAPFDCEEILYGTCFGEDSGCLPPTRSAAVLTRTLTNIFTFELLFEESCSILR
jgi:hypothetical protein